VPDLVEVHVDAVVGGVVEDRRVIDENVEAAEALVDGGRGGPDALVVGHIELEGDHALTELGRG
jgi:hypothetical protein